MVVHGLWYYRTMPKRGVSLVVDGKKWCTGCEQWLEVEDNFDKMTRKDRPNDSYHPLCHECKKEYHREYYRARRREDPTYGQLNNRNATLRKYGLTPEDYDRMIAEQDGKCAICGKAPGATDGVDKNRLVIDHDHKTGKARALLCDFCNRGIGMFFDDPDLLTAAIAYLLQHGEVMRDAMAL